MQKSLLNSPSLASVRVLSVGFRRGFGLKAEDSRAGAFRGEG